MIETILHRRTKCFVLGVILEVTAISIAGEPVRFDRLAALPDPMGFGGPIAGVQDHTLIVAGGANFPDGPPWSVNGRPPGAKVWHDRTFFLRPGDSEFTIGPKLPYPLAYAPAVSTPRGVYILGGETWTEETGNIETAEVLALKWDDKQGRVVIRRHALPPLPRPCSYHAAGLIGRTIYVAAGHARDDNSKTLDQRSFWSLDLSATEPRWVKRSVWPGAARHKMAVAVARGPEGTTGDRLYLISGSAWFRNSDGEHDLSRYRYFDDAFAFDPQTDRWTRLANLPTLPESRTIDATGYAFDPSRPAWISNDTTDRTEDTAELFDRKPRPAAAASAIGEADRVLIVSGSTGRYVTMAVKDRPPFPAEVLAYQIDSDRWTVAGRITTPVVTTALVRWNGRLVVISGETRPGVRTPLVQATPPNTLPAK